MSQVKHAKAEDFETLVLKSSLPALVDFWAEWCGPCRVVGPILEELSLEYKDQLNIVKVDVDLEGNGDLAARYGVRGIPTLILFKDGVASRTSVGALSKPQLVEFIKEALES